MKNFVKIAVLCVCFVACNSDTRLFQQAKLAQSQGNLSKALGLYNKLIRQNPQHAAALTNRGLLWELLPVKDAAERAKNRKYAEQDYLRALEINPNQAETYNNLGALYIDQKRNGDAVVYLSEAIVRQPKYFRALLNRANAYTNLGLYQEALSDFDRAAELKPNDPGLLLNRGLTYFDSGKYEAAVNDFSHAMAVSPEDARLYVERARGLIKMGYPGEAYEDLEEAVGLRPNYALAYYYLADLAFQNGEKDYALGLLVRAKELAPQYVPAYDLMGDMLATEDPVMATQNYIVALKLDPANAPKYRRKIEMMKSEEGRYRVTTERFFPQGRVYNSQGQRLVRRPVAPVGQVPVTTQRRPAQNGARARQRR